MRVIAWSRSLTEAEAGRLGVERCETIEELGHVFTSSAYTSPSRRKRAHCYRSISSKR